MVRAVCKCSQHPRKQNAQVITQGFIRGNVEFYTFIYSFLCIYSGLTRNSCEKYNYRASDRNRTCCLAILVQCSNQLSYRGQLSSSSRKFMYIYQGDAMVNYRVIITVNNPLTLVQGAHNNSNRTYHRLSRTIQLHNMPYTVLHTSNHIPYHTNMP